MVEYQHAMADMTLMQQDFRRGPSERSCRLEDSTDSTRIIRSHSLTPMGCYQASPSGATPNKIRSNSITFGARELRPNPAERPGMRGSFNKKVNNVDMICKFSHADLRDWMKSLRLHKYSDRLVSYSYDELLALTDQDLQKLMFTDGAKGKFLKQLSLVKERPSKLKDLRTQLDENVELRELLVILPELEKLILMPMRLPTLNRSPNPMPTYAKPAQPAVSSLSRSERRHDSGSDSGTEMTDDAVRDLDVAQELFELLEKTFSIIICKQHDDSDRDKVVRNFFNLLERRCLKKESFTSQQKHLFFTWLKRMDQVRDISKSIESSIMEQKRKYERRTSRDFSSLRRSSLQHHSPSSMSPLFSRGASPMSSSGGPSTSFLGSSSASPCLSLFSDRQHPPPPAGVASSDGSGSSPNAPRRSVPDIYPPGLCPQLKRNSYQGDHRMVRKCLG